MDRSTTPTGSDNADGSGDSGIPPLARTALYDLHVALGARMVSFAGYEMPVQYPSGIVAEHLHARTQAVLFDVSHMGQVRLPGDGAAELEALVPGDILGLKPGRMRYTQFTDERGGILDDLMVTRLDDGLMLVVNAACKGMDVARLREAFGAARVEPLADRSLLALQGPAAADVLARLAPGVETLAFMSATEVRVDGADCLVSRCGYTGEDGYEISVPSAAASGLAERLLAAPEVAPAGLGARDSLRLEAGLCLYGHDIDESTTPVEADLAWSIGKRRRTEGGFPGAEIIRSQLEQGPERRRVGLRPEGRAPAREGAGIVDADGNPIGRLTSGGFGPSVGGPVAMGYVPARAVEPGTPVGLVVRGKVLPGRVAALPFAPHRYYRKP